MSQLTPQQEQFCQNYVACKCNASEAYRRSYNCEKSSDQVIWNEAYRLMQNPYVSVRIQNLQQEQRERNKVTIDSLTEELNELKELAKREGQISAGVSAIMGKAKIHGFDKSTIEVKLPKVIRKDLTGRKE